MIVFKILYQFILFCIFTALTQVGGVVYLGALATYQLTDKWASHPFQKHLYRLLAFVVLYCVATFGIVPILAKPFGRVPMPITQAHYLQPLNVWTCLLNRHYVRPALQQAAFDVAEQMHQKYPETITNYLDANFPFIDRFPLLPHLSHNDGKKLDLSFFYIDSQTNKATNSCPSAIGYGICEEPLPNEVDTAAACEEKGFWQYSFLKKIVPQGNKKNYIFDSKRTRTLVQLFAKEGSISKIFIEPHLKNRLNIQSAKVRFHGCQAVRHDDHIHVQLR
jgi:hypothetical protein